MMDIIVTIAQGRGWAPFLEPHTVPKDYEGRCCGCNLINSELFPIGVAAQFPLHPLILIWMAGDVFSPSKLCRTIIQNNLKTANFLKFIYPSQKVSEKNLFIIFIYKKTFSSEIFFIKKTKLKKRK
jgi:hypothetical protein